MTVASVDYVTKRIYLDASTAVGDLDTLDVYREVRALRRTNEAHRKYKPMIVGGGMIQKTATTFTAPYVQLLDGCRLVPYNASHKIRLIRDTFTDDNMSGRDCFDRGPLGLTVEVDIDVQVDKVEVRTVATSGNEYTLVEISDSVWQHIIEAGFTAEQLMRLKASVAHGDATGLESNAPSYKSLDGSKVRVVATYVNGARVITARDAT